MLKAKHKTEVLKTATAPRAGIAILTNFIRIPRWQHSRPLQEVFTAANSNDVPERRANGWIAFKLLCLNALGWLSGHSYRNTITDHSQSVRPNFGEDKHQSDRDDTRIGYRMIDYTNEGVCLSHEDYRLERSSEIWRGSDRISNCPGTQRQADYVIRSPLAFSALSSSHGTRTEIDRR